VSARGYKLLIDCVITNEKPPELF